MASTCADDIFNELVHAFLAFQGPTTRNILTKEIGIENVNTLKSLTQNDVKTELPLPLIARRGLMKVWSAIQENDRVTAKRLIEQEFTIRSTPRQQLADITLLENNARSLEDKVRLLENNLQFGIYTSEAALETTVAVGELSSKDGHQRTLDARELETDVARSEASSQEECHLTLDAGAIFEGSTLVGLLAQVKLAAQKRGWILVNNGINYGCIPGTRKRDLRNPKAIRVKCASGASTSSTSTKRIVTSANSPKTDCQFRLTIPLVQVPSMFSTKIDLADDREQEGVAQKIMDSVQVKMHLSESNGQTPTAQLELKAEFEAASLQLQLAKTKHKAAIEKYDSAADTAAAEQAERADGRVESYQSRTANSGPEVWGTKFVAIIPQGGGNHNHPHIGEACKQHNTSTRHTKIFSIVSRVALREKVDEFKMLKPAQILILLNSHFQKKLGEGDDKVQIPKDLVQTLLNEVRSTPRDKGQASALVTFLQAEVKDKGGDFGLQLGDDERLRYCWWQDKDMQANAEDFGDIVILDTTGCTNQFNLPLLLAVVVDRNGHTKLGFAALLPNEGGTSFRDAFVDLKELFKGRISCIISDSDPAIISEVSNVFGDSVTHMLCMYHIRANLAKNLSGALGKDNFSSFMRKFELVYNMPSIEAFHKQWNQLKDEFPSARQYLEGDLERHAAKWARSYLLLVFSLGIEASQRVENFNFILGKRSNISKRTPLQDIPKIMHGVLKELSERQDTKSYRVRMQQENLSSARVLTSGPHAPLHAHLSLCLTPFAFHKSVEQLRLSHNYDAKDIVNIDDGIDELKKRQSACLEHRWGKPECDGTTEEVPNKCDRDLEKEARADDNFPNMSASFSDSSLVAGCALISYKHASGPQPAQLFVLFDDGSYFCSCGFPARIGLPCRHFYCAWSTRELKARPELHCGVQCHPRWFNQSDNLKDIFEVPAAIYQFTDQKSGASLKSCIESGENRWRSAYLKGIDGLCLGGPEDGQHSPQKVPDNGDEIGVTNLRFILDTISKVKQYMFNLPRTHVMLDDTANRVNKLVENALSLDVHAIKNPAVIIAKGRPRNTVARGKGQPQKKRKTVKQRWTPDEKEKFYEALKGQGQDKPDFLAASKAVGSKDQNQCRNLYHNDRQSGKWPIWLTRSQINVIHDDDSDDDELES